MKYWVYKESRVLGPFDKEAVSGFPGLDSGTLVCAGDPAGASWTPAGELAELAGIATSGGRGPLDEFPSGTGLLDQLQIEAAGLVADDDFPNSFAEELFQDAVFKKDFKDMLSDRIAPDESAARRDRDTISTLSAQLESLYRRISELETGNAELARLASPRRDSETISTQAAQLESLYRRISELETGNAELASLASSRRREEPPPVARTFLSPSSPPIPGGPPPVAAVKAPPAAEIPAEWPQAPVAGTAGFPSFAGEALAPPAPEIPPVALPERGPAPDELPAIPSFAAAAAPIEAPEPPAVPAAKAMSFGKPKTFKIVPTVRSFKVVGPEEIHSVPSQNPVPEFKFEPIIPEEPVAAAPPVPAAPPPPAPFTPPPPPVQLAPPPIPVLAPEPAPITNPFALPARPELAAVAPAATPVPPPPNTMSRFEPFPDLSAVQADSFDPTAQLPPPATLARSAAAVDEPVEDGAAARFAKPEPAPATGEIKKPSRGNKAFLIAGGVLLTLLIIVGVIFIRQPKDDLAQMTSLDDGKAPIGLPADDGALAPPPQPIIAEEPPAPAPPPGPSAEHVAAVEGVKDFPLDGGRGTVGRWLQYSYTASPDAGAEEWNASSTGENTVLVEYRLVPGRSGGNGALYLFEIDRNGIVMGKNIEARRMLAGGPPAEAPKAGKRPAKKSAKKAKRRAVYEAPREIPLLPLPDSGELRPPAEDDGEFGSDTINSGI